MGKLKYLLFGLVMGVILDGCATHGFIYRYYGVDAVSYDGTLLGPKPADDLSFKLCAPDEKQKGKCVIMLQAEFYRMKADFLNLENELKACQAKLP